MFFDWVSQMAKAPTAIIVTSVTMKGGMPRRATTKPLKRPMRAADGEHGGDGDGGRPGLRGEQAALLGEEACPRSGVASSTWAGAAVAISIAPTTLVRPMTAPWLRSMPAMVRTKVWPIATTRSGQMLDSRLVRLRGVESVGRKGTRTRK